MIRNSPAPLPRPTPLSRIDEGATRRPDALAPELGDLSDNNVRPSLSYAPIPRRSAGKSERSSPPREHRGTPPIGKLLAAVIGTPIHVVEPGTVVRSPRTGHELAVDDQHPVACEGTIYVTQPVWDRLKELPEFGSAVPA